MSASGSESGGNSSRTADLSGEPPVKRHETSQERCLTETGEKRIVVYQSHDGRWIDVASDDVLELSEMR